MAVLCQQVWEDTFSTRQWGRYPSEEVVRFYFGSRQLFTASPSALDIGCGAGACAWFLAHNGVRVTAIDGAPSALEQLKRTLGEFHAESVVTVLADITKPHAFVQGPFDFLVDHYSLYANPEDAVARAFAEYHSLLAVGGRFLVCLFGKGCTGSESGRRSGKNTFVDLQTGPHQRTGTLTLWTQEEATELLRSCGYAIKYWEQQVHTRNDTIIEKFIFHLAAR